MDTKPRPHYICDLGDACRCVPGEEPHCAWSYVSKRAPLFLVTPPISPTLRDALCDIGLILLAAGMVIGALWALHP